MEGGGAEATNDIAMGQLNNRAIGTTETDESAHGKL